MKADLKVTGGQFAQTLLGDTSMITGRLDSRYSGPTYNPLAETAANDPMDSSIDAPTIAQFNQYVRQTLNFGKAIVSIPPDTWSISIRRCASISTTTPWRSSTGHTSAPGRRGVRLLRQR